MTHGDFSKAQKHLCSASTRLLKFTQLIDNRKSEKRGQAASDRNKYATHRARYWMCTCWIAGRPLLSFCGQRAPLPAATLLQAERASRDHHVAGAAHAGSDTCFAG
ncbi:hypothetical protein [Novosphingobium sp. FKTRR1]|uniref:hypothetical protein n=1 Tax=Novosphingobium sp. FKTRR1 TaxID=2879118 RepID=UPI001CF020BC|nr:hypothetical protein [Novosphingobium sp. FKTRR1]